MRYLALILSTGLLLSVGLLAGSGPAHAAMPTLALDRSAVADTAVEKVAYYHRYARRHYRRNYYGYGYNYHRPYYGYGYRRPLVMVMGVAGGTETGPNSPARVESGAAKFIGSVAAIRAGSRREVQRWLDMPSHIPRCLSHSYSK